MNWLWVAIVVAGVTFELVMRRRRAHDRARGRAAQAGSDGVDASYGGFDPPEAHHRDDAHGHGHSDGHGDGSDGGGDGGDGGGGDGGD